MVKTNENKENKNEIILSSLYKNITLTRGKNNKPLSPIIQNEAISTPKIISNKINSHSLSISEQQRVKCKCISSKIIQFQLNLFNALNLYAKYRYKMSQLVKPRSKFKENIMTNSDQMHAASSSSLIYPDLCDEKSLKMNDDCIIKLLEVTFKILDDIFNDKWLINDLIKQERSFKKQFYESIDLLAQLYGFFGLLNKRIRVFNFKLEFLKLEFTEHNTAAVFAHFESVYSSCLLQLMKIYLNSNMCDEFVDVLLSDKVNKKNDPTHSSDSNAKNTYKLNGFQDVGLKANDVANLLVFVIKIL